MDLSVVIPARNEQWLARTVADVLEHAKAETEVIAVLDGAWPDTPLPQHPRLQVIRVPTAIGQRAATNLGVRLSDAEFVMKLDAHCAVGDGFDVALIEAARTLGDTVTQVPAQYNFHVFDWVCNQCAARIYQGPTPGPCACGSTQHHIEVMWRRRESRLTVAWRFDADLHFQYWGDFKHRPEASGDYLDTMSCLGACWFLSRARYDALGGMDEAHGSWGQMGTEVACKAWLSGGRLVTNRRTWFAHMFRTQGGDFGFPYPLTGRDQDRARAYSRDLWRGNRWPGQVRPLRWLVERFWPVPGWTPEALAALPADLPETAGPVRSGEAGEARTPPAIVQPPPSAAPFLAPPSGPITSAVDGRSAAGLVYYTDNRCPEAIASAVLDRLEATGLPGVAVSLRPLARVPAGWRSVVMPLERGHLTMFRQILAGIDALDTDCVFLVEHDVLYHPSHFDFRPPTADRYFYNLNVWKVDATTGRAVTYETKQTSGLCANRALLLAHYRERVRRCEAEGFSRRMGFEPGSHGRAERVDDVRSDVWRSAAPNVDVRHTTNLTSSRWSPTEFRDQRNCRGWTEADRVPGWAGLTLGRFDAWLREQSQEIHA